MFIRHSQGPDSVYLRVRGHVSQWRLPKRPHPGFTRPVCFEECRKGESSGGMSARKKRWGENTIAVLPECVTVDSNKVTACK